MQDFFEGKINVIGELKHDVIPQQEFTIAQQTPRSFRSCQNMVDTSIFVFELAEQTLGQYAAKTKQMESVRAVIYKVANAVCQMHKSGVIYNDLKSENIQIVNG